MIHHISMAAENPKMVADFFAELMNGMAIDFPPNPGGYMAFGADGKGTAVEVYPAGSIMLPAGDEGAVFAHRRAEAHTATHFALSVSHDVEAVRARAAALGWNTFVCSRGGHFHVLEVWVENSWLVEVLPPAFAAEYLAFAEAVVTGAAGDEELKSHGPKVAVLEAA